MHLFNIVWEGFMTGIALSLMLGTVFFALLRNSIQHGYKTGFYIASGVIACDIIFISLALLSEGFAIFLKTYQSIISIVGGAILIIMGLVMVIKAKPKMSEGHLMSEEKKSGWIFFINGFLLNLLNPINFFSWLAISTMLTIRFNYTLNDKTYFFLASLFSIFLVEIVIAFGASKVKQWMTPLVLKRINQISGLVFIGIGIKLTLVFIWP
ncbi:MAG: LysE family transporter [bacterium]|nr:LysE family transporter [bacterium]